MKKLLQHPLFSAGLVVRLCLILLTVPMAAVDWYAPFLEASAISISPNPWGAWIASGGESAAFPYGSAMWLFLAPHVFVGHLVGLSALTAYQVALFVADFLMLILLSKFVPNRHGFLLSIYWLSPITLLTIYVLGLNDIIPALLMGLTILFVKNRKFPVGALCMSLAISTKLSMVFALPILMIFLLNNPIYHKELVPTLGWFLLSSLILWLPIVFSDHASLMVFGTPELTKIFQLSIDLVSGLTIYIVPTVISVLLYCVWRVRRMNFDFFQAVSGVLFLSVVLLTPSSPGWFIWSLFFLVLYQAKSGRVAVMLTGMFSLGYAVTTLSVVPIKTSWGEDFLLSRVIEEVFPVMTSAMSASLLYSAMVALGVILISRIIREAVHNNLFFRVSRRPFLVGVAGDSGAGKDTFADAVAGLFGAHSVTHIMGDDYHLWDRHKPMWRVLTHLNPLANDLERFTQDVVTLADGGVVQKSHYNHQTGKMTKPRALHSRDFVIASGLHALYSPLLRTVYDLKIFLDIDEDLRRFFKVKRDVRNRGHNKEDILDAIESRKWDSDRYIRPQKSHADLIISLRPVNKALIEERNPKFEVGITTTQKINERSLSRVLVGVCGLHLDAEASTEDGDKTTMVVGGDPHAEDIERAAQILCPNLVDFLDLNAIWHSGATGIMQLLTLCHINQAFTKRLL